MAKILISLLTFKYAAASWTESILWLELPHSWSPEKINILIWNKYNTEKKENLKFKIFYKWYNYTHTHIKSVKIDERYSCLLETVPVTTVKWTLVY